MNVIVSLLLSLFMYALIPLGIIVGIILGITSMKINDVSKKQKRKKLAWNIALYPFVIALLILVLWGLVTVANGK